MSFKMVPKARLFLSDGMSALAPTGHDLPGFDVSDNRAGCYRAAYNDLKQAA